MSDKPVTTDSFSNQSTPSHSDSNTLTPSQTTPSQITPSQITTSSVGLSDDLKSSIQAAYRQFLNSKSLGPRYGQKLMIGSIARTLANAQATTATEYCPVCVVEAGTGTGKTVAYLLAAIPIAKVRDKRIVVSTATIALQEQIIHKDLPDLRLHSGLDYSFALAKGRGRYLCLQKLDHILSSDPNNTIPLYEEDTLHIADREKKLYEEMLEQLGSGKWNGDKDDWPEELDEFSWQRVTTDHRQCSGRKCDHVRQCAFFKARDELTQVDVIVANHDLVMADLALGGGAILPPPEETIYIFDEAHHLSDKALSHFSSHARLSGSIRWLAQLEGQWASLIEPLRDSVYLAEDEQQLKQMAVLAREKLSELQPLLLPYTDQIQDNTLNKCYRFERGEVPGDIASACNELEKLYTEIFAALSDHYDALEKLLDDSSSPIDQAELEAMYRQIGNWCARSEGNLGLWRSFGHSTYEADNPKARWLNLIEYEEQNDIELVSSPVLASQTLTHHLWKKAYSVVCTSATLSALGSFDRFMMKTGSPASGDYSVVPSPFDFSNNASINVPADCVEAGDAQAHTDYIVGKLPEICTVKAGYLALFSSRRQMENVYNDLPYDLRQAIFLQGTESKHILVEKHRKRVDAKDMSILFGLASFAEGLDLPGNYCQHVIIAKIPFAVPDAPLEAAMAEWVEARGGNSFFELSVPDASVRLVQASGRLLRTETDKGFITLLDKRIVTKRYGKALLDALPPFSRNLP